MPEDIPKAVMILLWLLIGVILFGWLLMAYPIVVSLVFALVFFGLPVLVYQRMNKAKLPQ